MKEIVIRTASKDDIETLLQFEQGVVSAERPYDPTLKPHPNYYYDIPQMIADPLTKLVVAESDGKLLGCGYARIEKAKSYMIYDKYAYLGFMYTDPGSRGKGVNQKIIEHLKSWSISKGITEMRLEVFTENESAIKAYEKAGFSKVMLLMRMGIS